MIDEEKGINEKNLWASNKKKAVNWIWKCTYGHVRCIPWSPLEVTGMVLSSEETYERLTNYVDSMVSGVLGDHT